MKKIFYLLFLIPFLAFSQGGITIPTGFRLQDGQPIDDRFIHAGEAGRNNIHDQFKGLFSIDTVQSPPVLYVKTNTGWSALGGTTSNIDLQGVTDNGNVTNKQITAASFKVSGSAEPIAENGGLLRSKNQFEIKTDVGYTSVLNATLISNNRSLTIPNSDGVIVTSINNINADSNGNVNLPNNQIPNITDVLDQNNISNGLEYSYTNGQDYTSLGDATITYQYRNGFITVIKASAPIANTQLTIPAKSANDTFAMISDIQSTVSSYMKKDEITFPGNNPSVILSFTPTNSNLMVFLQGILLKSNQYTLSGNTVTINSGLLNSSLSYDLTVTYAYSTSGSSSPFLYSYNNLSEITYPAPKGFYEIANDTNFSTIPKLQLYYSNGTAANSGQLIAIPVEYLNNLKN